jgi:hypothetical protein
MPTHPKGERRKHHRDALNGSLLILWLDEDGRERICKGHCVDVSSTGLRLRLQAKLPTRAIVMFNSPEIGIAGQGVTRFSVLKRAEFEIGIECRSGTGWRTLFTRLRSDIRGFVSEKTGPDL